jgi:negative regulator of flagellin synthesis FlgM
MVAPESMREYPMEITGKKTPVSLEHYIKNVDASRKLSSGATQPPSKGDSKGDKVELSDQAKQIQAATRLINAMPDVREDLVAQIREKISSGTYRIDPGKIAAAMLKEALFDEKT